MDGLVDANAHGNAHGNVQASDHEGTFNIEEQDYRTGGVSTPVDPVFHHVEDVADADSYPPWSTGVSRMHSRPDTPVQPDMRSNSSAARSRWGEEHFNAARIPLDMAEVEISPHNAGQVPIEDVIRLVETSQNRLDQEQNVVDSFAEEHYEHQNVDETMISHELELEPLLQQSPLLESNIDDDLDEQSGESATFSRSAVDEITSSHSDHLFQETDPHQDPFGAIGNDDSASGDLIPDTSVEVTPRVSQGFQFSSDREAIQDPAFADSSFADSSLMSVDVPNHDIVIDIPDDLDEADFDIEEELDEEFAALEANFQQNMTVDDPSTSTEAVSLQAPKALPARPADDPGTSLQATPPKINPYKPTNIYAPAPAPGGPVPQTLEPSLFTPAQLHQSTVMKSSNAYQPRLDSNSLSLDRSNASPEQPRKASTPSFVSGKVAYNDPYALPETLVAKKRSRPQAQQTLRSAVSVPNLKADAQSRPPIGQRHASAMGPPPDVSVQYQRPPPGRSPSVQNTVREPVTQADPNQFTTNTIRAQPNRQNSDLQGVQTTQAYAGRDVARPQISSPSAPTSNSYQQQPHHANAYTPRAPGMYSPQGQPTAPPSNIPGYGRPDGNTTQSRQAFNQSKPPVSVVRGASPYAPQASTQGATNIQPQISNSYRQGPSYETSYQVPHAAATADIQKSFESQGFRPQHRPSPLSDMLDSGSQAARPSIANNLSVAPESAIVHHRQSSSVSSQSHDSEVSRLDEYDDFLNEERGAENQMFDDSYAVAHEEIQRAQSIQRAGSAMNLRYNGDPRLTANNGPRTPPLSLGPRRSLDERPGTASLIMSRPPSRGPVGQYARTEPPSSPRRDHHGVQDGLAMSKMNASTSRPSLVSRATSSSQAYQTFPRTQSPRLFRQHSIASDSPGSSERHLGHPIASFGFGGRFLTTIPKTVPRFSPEGAMVTQIAGPGLVHVRQLKDVVISDVLADFPGPLLYSRTAVKQKKIDIQSWLNKQIPIGDAAIQDDRTILYRLLMILLDCNGVLDTPIAKGKLCNLLCPELDVQSKADELANFTVAANMNLPAHDDSGSAISTSVLTDSSVEKLAELMLKGDKDSALRFACDRKLWAHALVIASRMTPATWSNVVREFASLELQSSTDAAENLKFLYDTFASTSQSGTEYSAQTGGSTTGVPAETAHGFGPHQIEHWRKSLTMILNNRETGAEDHVICTLGHTLLANGRTHAAHFCYLLCNKPAIGASDDRHAAFSLVGNKDLANGGWTLEKNEAIVMSEIYEFCLSLSQPKFLGFPHLLALKLQRAQLLTDAGLSTTAKKYCEGITSALKLLPKGTTQLHHVLVEQLRDLTHRIDQNPGAESPSWLGSKIAKPKMDNIWGSLEGKFNKFVAGDAEQPKEQGEQSVSGPFAKLAQTPAISRVQSVVDLRSRPVGQQTGSIGGYDAETLRPAQAFAPPDQGSYPYAGTQSVQSYAQPPPVLSPAQSAQDLSGTQFASQYAPNIYQNIHSHVPSVQQNSNEYMPRQDVVSPFMPQQDGPAHTNRQSYMPPDYTHPAVVSHTGVVQGSFNGIHQAGQETLQADAPLQAYNTIPVAQPIDARASNDRLASPHDEMVQAETESKEEANSKPGDKVVESDEKKAGWLGGWFGGGKKREPVAKDGDVKVHKAKLGEGMSLVYDPVTKKWTNPKGTMPEESKTTAPPPPMARKPPSTGPAPMQSQLDRSPAPQAFPSSASQAPTTGPDPGSMSNTPMSNAGPTAPRAGVAPRKLASADDDLAAMLGSGPPSRRAAGASSSSTPAGSGRAKKGKPAKRYVDVFQDGS